VSLPLTADAAKSIQLKQRVTTGTLVDSDTQQPVAGKLVRGGDKATVTDDSGKFTFTGLSEDSRIDVDLIGYQKAEQSVGAASGDLTVAI